MRLARILSSKVLASAMAFGFAISMSIFPTPADASSRYFGKVTAGPPVVRLAGQEVFTIQAPAGGFTAEERTLIVERNMANALKSTTDRTPSQVQIQYINNIPVVRLAGFHVVTADSNSARMAGTTQQALAEEWAESMRQVLSDSARVDAYVASMSGDFLPATSPPERRARLEAARKNHAAFFFRDSLPVGLVSSDALEDEGMKLMNERKPSEAIEKFEKAISMNPYNARAHYGLGSALLKVGKLNEAIDHLAMSRHLNPDHAFTHIALGQAHEAQGNDRLALTRYREASLLQPANPEPYLLIADLREESNDMDKSVAELGAALDIIPGSEYIRLRRKDQITYRLTRPY